MTSEERQEAISQLERISGNLASIGETVDYTEFAIEALEQERSRSAQITQYRHDCEKLMEENERLKKALEQEPCEDCVSRQAVNIALLKKGQSSKRYKLGETWELNGSEIREAIAGVSSVTSKIPKGTWVRQGDKNKKLYGWLICSKCGSDMRGEEE